MVFVPGRISTPSILIDGFCAEAMLIVVFYPIALSILIVDLVDMY